MPRLMWLVRDQKLNFKDKQKNDIVEADYLELALSEIAKSTKRKLSNTRDKIMQLFPDRELCSIRNPLGPDCDDDPGDLQSMGPQMLS